MGTETEHKNPKPGTRRRAGGKRARATKSSVLWRRARDIGASVLIIVILSTAILSSLPNSVLKQTAAPVLTPVARATGLDQNWGMFAPNPPRTFSVLEVHVIMSNGEDRVWLIKDDPSMPGLYWRKIKEEVIKHKDFRDGLAAWVVRKMTNKGERPARVAMVVKTETLPFKGEPKRAKRVIYDVRIPHPKRNEPQVTEKGAPS
ncbi:hypothetical protein H7J88_24345 [Mycolicibacterium flavescens]|uniref:Uncharacterized protein n=1 Tax=Mycolicibacterium flavescens TaxID=1776 RepID=A0A1E3RFM6_MYCFV|nr:hypothetical protein [Mycolicibacterium flavescens]MCV7282770.1 hypothetical protein [Mycolicibacterium flavescens]ODQ88685.1 hypothetical protein BHQ18_17620 [Mycolicibacterium flavescens]